MSRSHAPMYSDLHFSVCFCNSQLEMHGRITNNHDAHTTNICTNNCVNRSENCSKIVNFQFKHVDMHSRVICTGVNFADQLSLINNFFQLVRFCLIVLFWNLLLTILPGIFCLVCHKLVQLCLLNQHPTSHNLLH